MKIKGHVLFGETAVGTIKFFSYPAPKAKDYSQNAVGTLAEDDIETEIRAFDETVNELISNLETGMTEQRNKGNKIGGDILEAHVLILRDEGFVQSFREMIENRRMTAAAAIEKRCREYAERFRMSGEEFLITKADDIEDIGNSLLRIINKTVDSELIPEVPTLLMAKELLPGDLIKCNTQFLSGLILEKCSRTSHVYILAKSMGIPVISEIIPNESWEGLKAIIDSRSGYLLLDPSSEELINAGDSITKQLKEAESLSKYAGREVITSSGKRIEIRANVCSVDETEKVLTSGADGIGLFRSEMTYLEAADWPAEDELFQIYSTLIKKMGDKPVIIRTLDIGADKAVPYMGLKEEENPAMGSRAIRQCLANTDMFRTQLRAIYKAAKYSDGNLSIMYPLISSPEELEKVKRISRLVREELTRDGLFSDNQVVKEGIMIETPAAAIMSDKLATMSDFFSIGTNDLAQYAYAADRNNPAVSDLYTDGGDAVLRFVQMIIDNAHKAGIKVGMCGELAANTEFTRKLIGMGIDMLSVSPELVLKIKKELLEND